MKQIRSQKAMVTGIVDLYLSPLASTRKGHRIRDVLKFNSATRIRTWKMLESESSALPFGDSATTCIIIADRNRFVNSNFKVFLLISQSDLI